MGVAPHQQHPVQPTSQTDVNVLFIEVYLGKKHLQLSKVFH